MASANIVTLNSQPITDWIKTRKAAIAEDRNREPDMAKRSAISAESFFFIALVESLIIIGSDYSEQIRKITRPIHNEIGKLSKHDEKWSIHHARAYGL